MIWTDTTIKLLGTEGENADSTKNTREVGLKIPMKGKKKWLVGILVLVSLLAVGVAFDFSLGPKNINSSNVSLAKTV